MKSCVFIPVSLREARHNTRSYLFGGRSFRNVLRFTLLEDRTAYASHAGYTRPLVELTYKSEI